MKPQKAVLRETGRIGAGVLVMTALMFAAFAALGHFDILVLWGGLFTSVLAVANFFIMGMTVQSITDKVGEQARSDAEIEQLTIQMKARMQTSYHLRTVALFALVVLGIAVFKFNGLATILPLAFPRLVILVLQLTGKASTSEGSDLK